MIWFKLSHAAMEVCFNVEGNNEQRQLTLTVLITTIDAQWEGMGDVGSARYERHYFPHARP